MQGNVVDQHTDARHAISNHTPVEIGFVISLVVVMMSIVFSAGVLWSQSNDHERRITVLENDYAIQHDKTQSNQFTTAARLARMETLLENIQYQQTTMASIIKKQETGK